VTAEAGREPVALAEILDRAVAAGLATQDDLDALDRGVVEAGRLAAEALARVEKLERRVAARAEGLRLATEFARAPWSTPAPARRRKPRQRHLSIVPPAGG
jgi:hypothetical protein